MIHVVYVGGGKAVGKMKICDECLTTWESSSDDFHNWHHSTPFWSRSMEEVLENIQSGRWDIPTWNVGGYQPAFTVTELY